MIRIEEQVRSARPDLSVVLSASAGSGKTRALVMRLMHLLLAGASPESIAAVTFTEKAAAEMKDRLFHALAEAVRDGKTALETLGITEQDAPYGIRKTPAGVLSELVSKPDPLKVQTIHALCLWLIRRFSAESGMLPGFEVADEAEAALMADRAVEETFMRIAAAGELAGVDTLVSHGMSIRNIKEALIRALRMRSRMFSILRSAGGTDAYFRQLNEGAQSNRSKLSALITSGEIAKLASDTHDIIMRYGLGDYTRPGYAEALSELVNAHEEESFRATFENVSAYFLTAKQTPLSRSPLTLGSIKSALELSDPGSKAKERDAAAREIRDEHDGLWNALRDKAAEAAGYCDLVDSYEALGSFMSLYAEADASYSLMKQAAGRADFDDLEIGAYALLSGDYERLAMLDVEPRLRHYLVDEFQDTSGLQWSLIRSLADEAFSGMGAEGIAGSTLFAVGDAKQSIYRFRNANYRLIGVLKDEMDERILPGRRDALELTANFRSAPEILRLVDETFSGLMGEGYSPTTHMDEGRAGSVRLAISGKDDEYETLARLVHGYRGIEITCPDTGARRGAGYGDMAVLVRSRRILPGIEEAFNSLGIQYRVVSGVGFFDRPEITAILGLLRYVHDPDDGLGLEAALRSDLFGLSKAGAHRVLFGGEYDDVLAREHPGIHGLIHELRSVMGLVSCGEAVDMAISRSGALAAFAAGHPTAHLNLEKLRSLADGFDRDTGGGFGDFLMWLGNYETLSDISAADPDTDGEGGAGAVSIMTVHSAKGLEFPVVFIPGCANRTTKGRDALMVGGRERDGIALRTKALVSGASLYARLCEEEDIELAGESDRLLYVGMTRARDHLVLTAEDRYTEAKQGPDKTSWLSRLNVAAPKSLFGDGEISLEGPAEFACPTSPCCYMDSPDAGETAYEPVKPDPGLIMPLSPGSGVEFISPSSLAGETAEYADTSSPWPAMLRGSIIHAALETYGRDGGFDIRRIAAGFPGYHNLAPDIADALAADMEAALDRLLRADEVMEVLKSDGAVYRELPLMARSGDTVIGGAADLVTVSGRTALIADYKTGLVGVPAAEVAEAYRPQLMAYAEAVRGAFGVEEVRTCLILVDRAEVLYI